jgi:NADH-quinone oxidoreductase subunit N
VTGDFSTVAFYLLAYSIVSVGAFGIIQLLARAGDQKTLIEDYAGIGFEAPALTFPFAIFMLSLAGIPSTAGFIGKFYVFKSAWIEVPALRYLVIVAVINSIISIYYYLYPIVVMFFRPLAPGFVKPRIQTATAIALILTILGTFYLGLMPNRLLRAMEKSASMAKVVTINR